MSASKILDATRCPLCGGANECQLCSPAAYKGRCWCAQIEIPETLLAQVPPDLRNKSCICKNCVTEFHRAKNPSARQKILPGDFYFDRGMMVFTDAYHLRRGFCCGSGCRHCPYPKKILSALAMNRTPQRIVCLSAEAADWFQRIGAWGRVVGVTAFFLPPPVTPPKPRVSGFNSANLEQIEKLNPDLIVTFSDVQAKLAAELMQRGFPVLATNQRTLSEIEMTLALLARIVDCERAGEKLLAEFRERLAPVERNFPRPRIYFEEWNEPLISGICWVSELIERACGEDIFSELQTKRAAMERAVSSEQICKANPEIIFASWCGKPVQISEIAARPEWNHLTAVRENHIYEISGEDILQPGFRLIYGYEKIKHHLQNVSCAALSH